MTTEQTSIVPYGAAALRAQVENLRAAVMVQDIDYGLVPGSNKMVLLKPGAEKMCSEFGFYPSFEQVTAVEQFDPDRPLFHYRYRAVLYRISTGERIAEGIGSCNSMEKKYRYRQGERFCPTCGKPTIIKGKTEYGGGWICFAKKGGCGAKFKDNDPQITGQQVEQVANTDIFDQINTLDKMAQKRALIAAVLIATNASAYFTQDLEDGHGDVVDGTFQELPRNSRQNAATSPRNDETVANGVSGHETPDTPQIAQNGHSVEIWPSEVSVGKLIDRIQAKDGLAPNAKLSEIARWGGVDDALNIEAWGKYSTRTDAALVIRDAVEAEKNKPTAITQSLCTSAHYLKERVYGDNRGVVILNLANGTKVRMVGRDMLRKLGDGWKSYTQSWVANGNDYVFNEADVKHGTIPDVWVEYDTNRDEYKQVLNITAAPVPTEDMPF